MFTPLRLRDGPVIIVPTGPLHSLAWSALPGLPRADGITIAPRCVIAQRMPSCPAKSIANWRISRGG